MIITQTGLDPQVEIAAVQLQKQALNRFENQHQEAEINNLYYEAENYDDHNTYTEIMRQRKKELAAYKIEKEKR